MRRATSNNLDARGLLARWGVRALALAFWLVVWQLAAWVIDARIVLVGPLEVLGRLAELALTGEFWASVGVSLGRIAVGLVLGVVTGTALAALASRSRPVRELLAPLVGALKAAPVESTIASLIAGDADESLEIAPSIRVSPAPNECILPIQRASPFPVEGPDSMILP